MISNDSKLIETKVDNIAGTRLRLNNCVLKFEEKDTKLQHSMSPQMITMHSTIGANFSPPEFWNHENSSNRPEIDVLIKAFIYAQTKYT